MNYSLLCTFFTLMLYFVGYSSISCSRNSTLNSQWFLSFSIPPHCERLQHQKVWCLAIMCNNISPFSVTWILLFYLVCLLHLLLYLFTLSECDWLELLEDGNKIPMSILSNFRNSKKYGAYSVAEFLVQLYASTSFLTWWCQVLLCCSGKHLNKLNTFDSFT